MQEVPLCDLNDFLSDDKTRREKFITTFGEGIRQLGFVRVKNHRLNQDEIQNCYKVNKTFFLDTKDEIKQKYHCDKSPSGNRGWANFGKEHAKNSKNPDLKEFFHVGREVSKDHPFYKTYGDNLWPVEVPEFKPTCLKMFDAFDKCAKLLLGALALYMGENEDFFNPYINDGNSILRIIYYPPISEDNELVKKGAIRAAEHEDINLMTILPSATASGLEILRNSDKKWIPVNDQPGEVVVDTGDMMARLTNHFFPATTHRVVNPGGEDAAKERMSMPFFVHCNPDALLDPKKVKVATTTKKEIPEPITANEFLIQRLKEIGLAK